LGPQADVSAAAAPPGAAVLWIGILTGPIAWACDLLIRYALVHWSCGERHTAALRLISLATLLLVVGGGAAAWRALRQTPSRAPTDGGNPVSRARFMAMLGVLTSVLFAVVVVAGAVPQWVLDACD
jgi:hypothetical protein